MLFALLANLFAVTEARTPFVQDKLTVFFNNLLGKYVATNIDRTKDTAKDVVYGLNWQHIAYVFIALSFVVRIPFLANFMSRNKQALEKHVSKQTDNKKNIALMVFLGLATFEGIYLVDKMNPMWAYMTDRINNNVAYAGLALGAFAIGHLLYLHRTLGTSWAAATVSVQKIDQPMKIKGPYGFARHPLYLNFLLHPFAVLLISQNWLLAAVFTPWVLYAVSRIKNEERLLIDQFGADYVDYMGRVPALGPLDRVLGRNLGLTKAEAVVEMSRRGEKKDFSSSAPVATGTRSKG